MFMLEWDLIPENVDGQVFVGWATEKDGDVVYTWSDDENNEHWVVDNDGGTFYAVWKDGVKVTFHGMGGKYYEEEGERADCILWWVPGERMYMLADYLLPNPDPENQAFLGWATEEDGDVVYTWSDDDDDENWTVADDGGEFYAVWKDGVIVRFHAGENGKYHDDRGHEYETQVAVWMPGEWHNLLEEDWLRPDMDDGMRLMGWKDSDGKVIAWDGEDEDDNDLREWQVPEDAEPGETSFDFYAYNEELVTIYEWAYDNRTVTAKRYWNITNAPEETETVDTNGIVTKEATCVDKGETTYTATFTSSSFTTQTKVVKDVDIVAANHDWGTPTYTWSADNSTVTAKCVCANDPTHIQVETADATSAVTTSATCTAKGKTTYTATFDNSAFSAQTKTLENIDALGHNWGAWTKVSDATTSSPEQQRRICARCNAVETRSVGDKLPTAPAVVESPQVISPNITIPKVPAAVKAKAAKNGKVTVSWKAIKKSKKTKALLTQIKWIELQCSTDPTFATDVITKNIGKKKTKVTLKLQKKTVYYIRVRYTGRAGGVSNWSAVKKVRTKK